MNTPKPQSFSRSLSLSGSGRLDALLRRIEIPETPWLTRSVWEYLFNFKYVRDEVGRPLKPGLAVEGGMNVNVEFPGPFLPSLGSEGKTSAKPIYVAKDNTWAAFVKPAGTPSFPRFPWERGTFVEQVAGANEGFYDLGPPPSLEGGLVQRLDVGTSGAILVAYDLSTKDRLRGLLTTHSLLKTYHAIVHGNAELDGENHTFYLSQASPEKMRVDDRMMGRPVDAWIHTLQRSDTHSLVEFQTRAGVRHQVRAILAKMGYPLVGDALYGAGDGLPHHLLHASSIEFPDAEPGKIIAEETDFFRSKRLELQLQ